MEFNFIFESPDHVRYENSKHVSGPHGGAGRIIKVEPAIDFEDNYLVTIYNSDGNHPLWQNNIQMSTKQMKLIERDENKIVLRGWGEDSLGQKFENYGLIVIFTNQKILNCILRLYDRNVYIKYLNHDDLNNPIEIDSISDLTQQIKNGVIIENKIDGEKAEWTYLDNVKHGEWKTFFSNGQLKENGYLNQGTPEGAWKAFNNNGTLRAIGQYEKGYQVGHWKFNDERGCLRAEGSYINGKQKGKWTYYDENGEIEGSEVL